MSPVAKRAIAYANPLEYFTEYAQELAKLPEVYRGVDFNDLVIQLKSLKADLPDKKQPEEVQLTG